MEGKIYKYNREYDYDKQKCIFTLQILRIDNEDQEYVYENTLQNHHNAHSVERGFKIIATIIPLNKIISNGSVCKTLVNDVICEEFASTQQVHISYIINATKSIK